AVDGSNQLGAMVTCHAMTARPDGAGGPAVAGVAAGGATPASSKKGGTRRQARAREDAMRTPPGAKGVGPERSREDGSRLRPRRPRTQPRGKPSEKLSLRPDVAFE